MTVHPDPFHASARGRLDDELVERLPPATHQVGLAHDTLWRPHVPWLEPLGLAGGVAVQIPVDPFHTSAMLAPKGVVGVLPRPTATQVTGDADVVHETPNNSLDGIAFGNGCADQVPLNNSLSAAIWPFAAVSPDPTTSHWVTELHESPKNAAPSPGGTPGETVAHVCPSHDSANGNAPPAP
jgi:hypothetical protein